MRRVREAVATTFGRDTLRADLDPADCVAVGAAIIASERTGDIPAKAPSNASTRSLHMETDGTSVPLIPKGTPYPLREPVRLSLEPADRRVCLTVCQGDANDPLDTYRRADVELKLPEEADPHSMMNVGFNYDPDGCVTVTASVADRPALYQFTLEFDDGPLPS